MGRPSGAIARFLVHKNADTRRGNGRLVEVKNTVHLGPSGEFGINARTAEEIQGKFSLWEESIP